MRSTPRPARTRLWSPVSSSRLAVVEHQAVDPSEHLQHVLAVVDDPMVHRVGYDQLGAGALVDDPHLHLGGPVRQEEELALAVVLRQDRIELGHHVEAQVERLAVVHVFQVTAAPAERFAAGNDLQAGRVDLSPAEQFQVFRRPVFADHASQQHRREKTGGIGKENGRAAQHVLAATVRGRFHAVQRN